MLLGLAEGIQAQFLPLCSFAQGDVRSGPVPGPARPPAPGPALPGAHVSVNLSRGAKLSLAPAGGHPAVGQSKPRWHVGTKTTGDLGEAMCGSSGWTLARRLKLTSRLLQKRGGKPSRCEPHRSQLQSRVLCLPCGHGAWRWLGSASDETQRPGRRAEGLAQHCLSCMTGLGHVAVCSFEVATVSVGLWISSGTASPKPFHICPKSCRDPWAHSHGSTAMPGLLLWGNTSGCSSLAHNGGFQHGAGWPSCMASMEKCKTERTPLSNLLHMKHFIITLRMETARG